MNEFLSMKICAVIVTFNRQKLLLRCIDAVLNQSYKCYELLIIDNASSDNTIEVLKNRFNYQDPIPYSKEVILGYENNIKVIVYRNHENIGGAGGFSTGLQIAHKSNLFDAFWLMDDDGYPSVNCLKEQIRYLGEFDYIMPVSIDIDRHDYLSWPTVLPGKGKTISYSILKDSWGKILKYVYPFNGSLLSKKLVDEVGYIDKRLFIWGDEYDHYWRCKKGGFNPITVIDAKFYHPSNKMAFEPIFFGLIKVPFVDQKWKMVCLARNYTYIYRHYNQWYKIPLKFLLYSWLFLITRKGDVKGWKLYLDSVIDGFKEKFDRHKKYMQ